MQGRLVISQHETETRGQGKPAFILVITAMTPVMTLILWVDQPMAIEGSMYLMTPGMACKSSPGPTTIATVARKKISVVLPNMKMCPWEWNKDPLELKRKLRNP
jgi:hypothetical protein